MVEFEAAPLSEVAEAGAVFEQGLSKQSKVALRSGRVQHGSTWFNMVQHGSTWFNMVQHGSTWFNMVQRHFAPSSLPPFLSRVSLNHNALEVLMREMVRVKQ